MAELVADCPRCNAKKITFNLLAVNYLYQESGWKNWYEVFSICKNCKKSTIFVLSDDINSNYDYFHSKGFFKVEESINKYTKVEGYISLKEHSKITPPEFLPNNIEKIFREGAICASVACYNASGTMFRLCIDLATQVMLPEENENGLNNQIRRSLGLRLNWLFENKKLPDSLKELSRCIKDDGNDGAHEGTLTKEDIDDIVDFTYILFERLYTEPERLRLAEERRKKRRETK